MSKGFELCMSSPMDGGQAESNQPRSPSQENQPNPSPVPSDSWDDDRNWADPDVEDPGSPNQERSHLIPPETRTNRAPVSLVETAFLASTASLMWLVSYYLSLSPWMRIFFPTPIALVYLRWGARSAWMAATVTSLLLSILMGPYLSLLFLLPYGLLGVQLGALWRRRAAWSVSISTGTLISTLSFFFRVWLVSIFLGEDVWNYLNNRIADFLEWLATILVNWGILDIGFLGRPDVVIIQLMTVGAVLLSDVVYLFTIHLGAWVILNRLGNPIPDPPEWVQVLLEEEA